MPHSFVTKQPAQLSGIQPGRIHLLELLNLFIIFYLAVLNNFGIPLFLLPLAFFPLSFHSVFLFCYLCFFIFIPCAVARLFPTLLQTLFHYPTSVSIVLPFLLFSHVGLFLISDRLSLYSQASLDKPLNECNSSCQPDKIQTLIIYGEGDYVNR